MSNAFLGKYEILNEMGRGKFGVVYQGLRIKDREPVAIKIESHENIADIKILKHETTILNYLRNRGCTKIPAVYWYGIFREHPTVVMSYYDMSLDTYITDHNNMMDRPDRIMTVLLDILRTIHKHHVIHRDIKPANFMLKGGELVLIDFGLATFYVDEDVKHIKYKEGKDSIIGTPIYVSPNVHNLVEPTRRDDLISLGYIYMKMILGTLSWENAPNMKEMSASKSWENISSVIQSTKIYNYMRTCYQLEYENTIDYSDWITIFFE